MKHVTLRLPFALCLLAAARAATLDVEAIAARNLPAVYIVHGTRIQDGAPVQGSGCCVHRDGYILATAHQAEGVHDFTAQSPDGSVVPLALISSRPEIEFSLFKAPGPLPAAADIGDAAALRSGAPIVSIASPISLEFSTVTGTVSNPNKAYNGYDVLLVTLTATHGSSGGPVFDKDGRLIGLISGGLTDVDFTIVNKINNAYELLSKAGITPPAGENEIGYLVPPDGVSDAERRAIDAYNRGVAADAAGEKIEAYTLATTLSPEFFEAHFNLAVTQAGAGHLENAARSYLRADKLRPASLEVKRNLGRLYLQAKQYDDAIAVFAEAVRLAPDDPRGHNDLGEACRRANRLDEAIRHLNEALRLNKDAPNVHYNLALAQTAAGNSAEATAHFEAYLALAPQAPDAAEVRAWIQKLKSTQ